MRLARGQKYRLSRLHLHVIQHERAEGADVGGELAVEGQDEIPHVLLCVRYAAVLIALDEDLKLCLEERLVRGHHG